MKSIQLPLVSVYVTNYNYGKFIKKALDSLLSQTFQDFEIIIIDDGSTDDSRNIIESYSQNEIVHIIYQQNKGLNVSNNIALRVAQGKYIMRLDADDFLDRNALLVMTNILEKDDEMGMVFPDYYIVDEDGEILSLEKRHKFDEEVSLLDQPAHGACTMIRKKYLQILGGYDEQYKCQDGYELWIKFTAKYKVTNIDTPLFYYRRHGSNLTSNENKILDTRAKIKDNFVSVKFNRLGNNLAIIPVRGNTSKANDIALMPLGKKLVVDRLIESAKNAKNISKIVVSSPSADIENHIKSQYIGDIKILFHKRDEALARLNVSLTNTLLEILKLEEITTLEPENLVILSIENPLIRSEAIDDMVNSMKIFNTDSMISVREESLTFFQHDGHGMKPILNQEKFSKFEREAIYKHAGGMTAVKTNHFLETKKIISGRVGHIVIDQVSAHSLKTKLDRNIAEYLVGSFQDSQ